MIRPVPSAPQRAIPLVRNCPTVRWGHLLGRRITYVTGDGQTNPHPYGSRSTLLGVADLQGEPSRLVPADADIRRNPFLFTHRSDLPKQFVRVRARPAFRPFQADEASSILVGALVRLRRSHPTSDRFVIPMRLAGADRRAANVQQRATRRGASSAHPGSRRPQPSRLKTVLRRPLSSAHRSHRCTDGSATPKPRSGAARLRQSTST
jgi:hypothetical protein